MLTETSGVSEFKSALIAAVAGLVVGAIIKFVTKVLEKDKSELETHVILRKELREELDAVRLELHRIQVELDEWKQKYYDQVTLTNELKMSIFTLNEELSEYKRLSGSFPAIIPDNTTE